MGHARGVDHNTDTISIYWRHSTVHYVIASFYLKFVYIYICSGFYCKCSQIVLLNTVLQLPLAHDTQLAIYKIS